MAKPPRKGTKRSALPEGPDPAVADPGRVPTGGRGATDRGRAAGQAGPVTQGAGRAAGPRHGLGGEQVEGRQAVRELLLAGRRKVREIWLLAEQDQARRPRRHRRAGRGRAGARPAGEPREVLRGGPLRGAPGRAGQGGAPGGVAPRRPGHRPAGRPAALPRRRRRGHRSRQPRRAPALGRVRGRHRDRAAPPPGRARHADGHQGGGRGGRAPALRRRRRPPDRAPAAAPSTGCGWWASTAAAPPGCGTSRRPTARSCSCSAPRGAGLSRLVRQRCDEIASIPLGRVAGVAERGRGGRAGLLRGRPRPLLARAAARIWSISGEPVPRVTSPTIAE